eukprot:EG_transcript_46670
MAVPAWARMTVAATAALALLLCVASSVAGLALHAAPGSATTVSTVTQLPPSALPAMPHGRPTSSALRSAANPERPVGGHSVRPQGTAQGGGLVSSLTLAGGAALIVAAAGWALRRWQGD